MSIVQHSNDDIKVGAATVTGAAINNDDKTQDSVSNDVEL